MSQRPLFFVDCLENARKFLLKGTESFYTPGSEQLNEKQCKRRKNSRCNAKEQHKVFDFQKIRKRTYQNW